VDLVTNLHYFEERYGAILAHHDEQRDSIASVRGTPFRRVEELYYNYVHSQNIEVHSMLHRIAAMPEVAQQPADE
jgi:hypothetical protein